MVATKTQKSDFSCLLIGIIKYRLHARKSHEKIIAEDKKGHTVSVTLNHWLKPARWKFLDKRVSEWQKWIKIDKDLHIWWCISYNSYPVSQSGWFAW